MLEALGMTRGELAARIGKKYEIVEGILTCSLPITPATATELEKVFGVPACFWNNRERRYKESLNSLIQKEGSDNRHG